MKFKKDKFAGEPARALTLADKQDDTLRVTVYEGNGAYPVIIDINDKDSVGLTRSKALKLAWAIIEELNLA